MEANSSATRLACSCTVNTERQACGESANSQLDTADTASVPTNTFSHVTLLLHSSHCGQMHAVLGPTANWTPLSSRQSAEADERMCLLLSCSSSCIQPHYVTNMYFWLHRVFYSVLQRPAVHLIYALWSFLTRRIH